MAKPGCGAMAGVLIVFLALIIFGGNEAVGIYFAECPEEEFFDCLYEIMESEDEEPAEGSVSASGTYEHKGYSVNLTLNIPLEGGNVTGVMTGACDGKVTADYTGAQNGLIKGRINGTCDPFLVKLPASADFNGSVNKTSKTVSLPFSARATGYEHSGTMNLAWRDEKKE